MRAKLVVASFFTLLALFSLVLFSLVAFSYLTGIIDLVAAITITVFINILVFFVSPAINDFIYAHFFRAKFYRAEEFPEKGIRDFVLKMSQEYGVKPPKILLIEDDNPTAFTYGSTPSRARIAISRGILKYLDEGERKAVIAHEFGHIVHWDFLVMTIAITLSEILYLLAETFFRSATRARSDEEAERTALLLMALAMLTYFFYIISRYVVLYLSRIREYYADEHAAYTSNPNDLARALIKIAYGISENPETRESMRLLRTTEALGIMSFREAYKSSFLINALENPSLFSKLFAFELNNPWAFISELNSTHPLTAKRIARLMDIAQGIGVEPLIKVERVPIDKRRVWSTFALDLLLLNPFLTSVLLSFLAFIATLSLDFTIVAFLVAFPSLNLARLFYSWPPTRADEVKSLDLLLDPYASPVKGRRVRIRGTVIGRVASGLLWGEDIVVDDGTARMFIDYKHWLPVIGDALFGLVWVDKLIGKEVEVEGWFFRGMGFKIEASKIRSEAGVFSSYPRLTATLALLFSIVLLALLI